MSRKYGYVRKSTKKQNIDRQIVNILKEFPDTKIYEETFTGTKVEGRKEFNKLLRLVQSGDTIIFDSVNRMSRDADEGERIYFELYDKGVNLVFLKERHIDTDVYKQLLSRQLSVWTGSGNASMDMLVNTIIDALNKYTRELAKEHIRLAFKQAEREAQYISEVTKEGLRVKKEVYGIIPGPEKGATYNIKDKEAKKQEIRKHSKSFGGSLSDNEVMRLIGISHGTYYKYKKEIYEELRKEQEVI